MILFDVEPLQNPDYQNRGIGRYVRNLISRFSQFAPGDVAIGYNGSLPPPDLDRLRLRQNVIPITRPDLRRLEPDWLVTCSPFEESLGRHASLFREAVPSGKIATIVYDLIPLVFEEDYLTKGDARTRYALGLDTIAGSDLALTISEHTSQDCMALIRNCPPVLTIGTGVDDVFFAPVDRAADQRAYASLIKRYPILKEKDAIFTVSGAHRSKNLIGFLEGYALCAPELRAGLVLVIGGGFPPDAAQFFQQEWRRIVERLGKSHSEILILPHVTDQDIRALYNTCRTFVYSSLYEGYGLPLAEAAVSGAVTVGSDRASMREILSAAYRFDPTSPASISSMIEKATWDDSFRTAVRLENQSRRDEFRWQNVVEKMASGLEEARVENPRAKSVKAPVKPAYFGPLPPARTGIASYNSGLLPYLTAEGSADWYTVGGDRGLQSTSPNVLPYEAFKYDWQDTDQTVYVVGNSFHHIRTLETLEARSGVVWLHDVVLSGLAWDYANHLTPENPWASINAWLSKYPTHMGRSLTAYDELQRSPFLFARPLLANAQGFIVHSEHAKSLLTADLGGRADGRPIHVVPHAVPRHEVTIERRTPDKTRPITIGMVGYMAPIRAPERTIAAAALLAREGWKVEVRIVGNCTDEYFQSLVASAKGTSIALSKTGYLGEGDFLREIEALDIMVQLRLRSNGESSGTVAHAIGLGVPVVTNIPSVEEFWSDAVECIESDLIPENIAVSMRKCLTEAGVAKASAGREIVLKSMSFEAVGGQIASLISRIA